MQRSAKQKPKPGRRPRGWSYSTGEWGTNRVRVFDRGAKGLYCEWWEAGPAPTSPRKRVRMALGSITHEAAKEKADAIALRFRKAEPVKPAELTLGTLFDIYEREVTPSKGQSKREHDKRCAEMFLRYFGRDRKPLTLSLRDWQRFIAERRSGKIAPKHSTPGRAVADRVIAYDLRYLLSVFNWATMAGDGKGSVLLDRNPFKGFALPKEESPRRPMLTPDTYAALMKVAPQVSPQFGLFLLLVHDTGHRGSSVRQLQWPDVDLDRKLVTWRGAADKLGFTHTTPLTDAAAEALDAERKRRGVIGGWVFPKQTDRTGTKCTPRSTTVVWWRRAEELAGVQRVPGLGWHSARRQFATDLKQTPLVDVAALGGWKDTGTILECYQQPDEQTQRAALAQRPGAVIGEIRHPISTPEAKTG